MIVVCGMETSATIRWPWTLFPCHVLPNADGVGETDMWTGTGINMEKVQIFNLFACPMNPLTSHSATQWGEECMGVKGTGQHSVWQI